MKPRFAVGLVVLGLISVALAADKVAVADILKDPAKYDGKEIAVQGVVEDFTEKVSGGGNAYTTLKVNDGGKKLTIWMRGQGTRTKNGDEVVAVGLFQKERKVGDVAYKNELDITPKPGKEYGLKVVKSAGN